MKVCPIPKYSDLVRLSEGAGGREMNSLIKKIRERFPKSNWKSTEDDSAHIQVNGKLFFTSDSYVVTPIFFPGGDIGKIAFCGTVNDLAVMGAKPLGLSLSLIIEEGLPKEDLFKIIDSIAKLSKETGVPIVTGDTKVMEKGAVDKIIINTSGVGITDNPLTKEIKEGDKIIVSGSIGDHGAALLAKRFDIESCIITDSKPLWDEISKIAHLIKRAKDITRGGLAAVLNELCPCELDEKLIPIKREVKSLTEFLGLDPFSLACEGRFVCVTNQPDKVLELLPDAKIIGEVTKKDVVLNTGFGKRLLPVPSGNIVPRIC